VVKADRSQEYQGDIGMCEFGQRSSEGDASGMASAQTNEPIVAELDINSKFENLERLVESSGARSEFFYNEGSRGAQDGCRAERRRCAYLRIRKHDPHAPGE